MRIILLFCTILFFCTFSSWSVANTAREDKVYGTNLQNSPNKGTVHTWVDPQTGDKVISVKPKGKRQLPSSTQSTPQMPIYVFPQITPQQPTRPHPNPSVPRPQPRVEFQSYPSNNDVFTLPVMRIQRNFMTKKV